MAQKFFGGVQVRRLREANALTQAAFADRLGLSTSYLNQIENNQRPLTAAVLVGLAQSFSVDLSHFAQDDAERLMGDLREALADPVFLGLMPNIQDLKSVSGNTAWFAHAFLKLHLAFRRANERLQILDEAVSAGQTGSSADAAAMLPYEEVRDFFHYRSNYFAALDEAAEALAETIGARTAANPLADYLLAKHAVRIENERIEPSSRFMRRFDRVGRVLALRDGLDAETRTFQIAHQIGLIEQTAEIDAIIGTAAFRSPAAAAITRIALANYFAGALLMPYGRFLAAARAMRYDVERLSHVFGTSFEQVGHRLSTLQRPSARGVPFYFVRVDRAGNIIKRHSSTRFQFARFGGSCPLWNVHEAFEAGNRILVQVAEMPDGARYLSIARAATKSGGSFSAPPRHFALGIGCEMSYAGDVIYADALDAKAQSVAKIGPGCRICERADCPQRAMPPIDRPLIVESDRRDFTPFRFT